MSSSQEQPAQIASRAAVLNLAAHRQQKGITLEQIAEATRIGLHFLQAIEAEDFQALPGGVYNTSYIRQYARAASFDESELVQHYLSVASPQPAASLTPGVVSSPGLPGEQAVRSFLEAVRTGRRSQHTA